MAARALAALDTHASALVVCATGGGKTATFSVMAARHSGPVAITVHRKEIVAQISLSLGSCGVAHRIVAPPAVVAMVRRKHYKKLGRCLIDKNARAGVASVQTLCSASSQRDVMLQRWVASVTLAIFDEGHHYVRKGQWAAAVDGFSRAKRLFFSATPERADGLDLGADTDGFAEVMIEGPSTAWLINEGRLSPFEYFAPEPDLDYSDIPITASGELNTRAMRKRIVGTDHVGRVVAHYSTLCLGKRAIVFSNDVDTATETAADFNAHGVPAAVLHGGTEDAERERAIERFEAGELLVLVNVDLFDEGFDVPAADAAILDRKTESLAKYLQMCGRVLRPVYADGWPQDTAEQRHAAIAAGSKPTALIIDIVRNWERHGLPNWPRVWSLYGKKGEGRSKSAGESLRSCLKCTQPFERYLDACPWCGEPLPEPTAAREPSHVDGVLSKLDVDAMAELFERVKRANSPALEYAEDQARRRIPPIGRPADMRRHLAAIERRRVLHEMVAWWFGVQPKTDTLNETQRKFYQRFGVDVGTAMTLSEGETDALITKITRDF